MPLRVISTYGYHGLRSDKVTHDFCKKETWYQNSIKVENEVLSTTDNTIFTPAESDYWVDVSHGKISGERRLHAEYRPVIAVNDSVVWENDPEETNKDYSIDYTTGTVTFNTALQGTDVVKATYHNPTSSLFTLQTTPGQVLEIAYVEIQFAENIILNDTLVFQLWGSADALIPGVYPPGTMIPLANPDYFQTMDDFIADAEKSYPIIPAFTASNNWRHYTQPRVPFRFDYTDRLPTKLISSGGYEIRCWLENHTPYGGEYATGTFYGIKSEEE